MKMNKILIWKKGWLDNVAYDYGLIGRVSGNQSPSKFQGF